MKAIRFVADSSLVAFASLLSCMRQSLHSLVRIHHLLHPSLALLLCFRSLPSEPQVGVCDPVLLMATVLQSRHGLMRVWIAPGANHCSHLLDCTYLLLLPLSTLTGMWLAPPFLLPSPRSSFPFPYSSLLTFSHRILHRIQSVPYLRRGTTATGMLSTCALLLDALAVLPSPLSRAIRFADDSSPFLDKQ